MSIYSMVITSTVHSKIASGAGSLQMHVNRVRSAYTELVPVTVRQHTKANHKILRDVHELMTGPCSMSTIQTKSKPARTPPRRRRRCRFRPF